VPEGIKHPNAKENQLCHGTHLEKNQEYSLDYVSATIQKRINESGFKNSKAARLRLEDIERCGQEMLVWKPESKAFLRSPLDWRAWRTIHGKRIYPEDHLVRVWVL